MEAQAKMPLRHFVPFRTFSHVPITHPKTEATMERTLIDLFLQSVRQYPDNPLMWEKSGGAFQPTSYRAAFTLVCDAAAGLMSLGMDPGDRVVLLSEGRNDWVFSELAVLFTGGISVPVSIKLNEPEELRFRFAHSGARYIIVSERQLGKVLPLVKDLPDLKRIIVLDPYDVEGDDLICMATLREMGREFLRTRQADFDRRWQSVKEDDPANICYTSGTTADPKGIILTHRNYTANVEQSAAYYRIPQYYKSLIILPWDHSFAHTCGIYTLMRSGASMAAVEMGKNVIETTRNIGRNIKEVQPHFLLSVPALSDNFKKNIERGIEAKGGVAAWLFRQGLKVAYAYQGDGYRDGRYQGKASLAPLYRLFDRILFSKIRQEFGGRLEFFVGGGALLDIAYQRFFAALGIPVYQGYGLSEAAPVISANNPDRQKMGTSGPVVPNLEIKICDGQGRTLPPGEKGEIVVKGENVMKGYWKNPEATEKTIQDGWLFTGDMGYMDPEGFLMVLGRFKSLLISNDGEKYSPEGIEESLVGTCKAIAQIMLYNAQRPYTTALIVPNKAALVAELRRQGLSLQNEAGQKAAIGIYVEAIRQYQCHPDLTGLFPGKWLPSTFRLLDEPFTEANRFLNSTMKMVRHKITEAYAAEIENLYTPEGKDPQNADNRRVLAALSARD